MTLHATTTDLETAVGNGTGSPVDEGTVDLIICRPAAGEREILQEAVLDLEEGLIGDNWRARGSRHTTDGSANREAQITLMNSRIVQAIAGDRSRWPLAGDQFYVDFDLSEGNLPAGQRIAIGSAVLEISATPHTGCAAFTERFGSDAIRFVNSPEGRQQRRRGVNARIVQPGTVRPGDTIRKVTE